MALKRTLCLVGTVIIVNHAFSALDPTVLPVLYGQSGGAVAVGPANMLVAWNDYRRTEDFYHEIYGTRVSPSGQALDGDGIPLTGTVTGGPALAALRDQFLIVWAKGPNVYARRMRSSGELLDARPITVSANATHPDPNNVYLNLTAASDGLNFWVAWIDYRHAPVGTPEYQMQTYQDVYAARITSSGQVLDRRGIRVCGRGGMQDGPRLSPRGDFLAWTDFRVPGRPAIFGSRLRPKGLLIDIGGFEIARSTNYFSFPDVAVNATGWLVVWGEPNGIRGAKVNRNKGVSRPFTIARTSDRVWPQVESYGDGYVVLWQSGSQTLGVRVSGSKQAGQTFIVASDPNGAANFLITDLAVSGSRYCVTGTTQPMNTSWLYNDIWFAPFSRGIFP